MKPKYKSIIGKQLESLQTLGNKNNTLLNNKSKRESQRKI